MMAKSGDSRPEVMVSAALDGHDLAAFEPLDQPGRGYQARCRRCGKTVWVGEPGLIYSLLEGECHEQ